MNLGLYCHSHTNIRHCWYRRDSLADAMGVCARRRPSIFQLHFKSRPFGIEMFSSFTHLYQVDERSRLPLYAIGLTTIVNLLLALINIGSSVGFGAFISLIVASYYSSFILSATVMLHKRLNTPNAELPWGPFKLGRAGVPVTIVAIAYSVLGAFFSMWPTTVNPTIESMNYCILVFAGVLIFSLLFWIFYGRRHYTGPVLDIRD